jgi:hypothetical protein
MDRASQLVVDVWRMRFDPPAFNQGAEAVLSEAEAIAAVAAFDSGRPLTVRERSL